MKNLFVLVLLSCLSFVETTLEAQNSNYLTRNPIYDYTEIRINNIDTIAGYLTSKDKLKITGFIYQSDGVTPAKDVLLYIEQADENGDYQIKTKDNKRYMYNRAWIKTDESGQYTFFTFIPGAAIDPITYPKRRGLKKIYPVIKETTKTEYNLDALLFNDDALLTNSCRKRLKRKGIDCILEPKKVGNLLVVKRDIILEENTTASR